MDIENFWQHRAELLSDGYRDGYTDHANAVEFEASDREIIERKPCEACGGAIRAHALSRYNREAHNWDFRLYGVCGKCNAAFEF